MRTYRTDQYLALKSAFRRACEDCGSLSEIAGYTRVSPSLLSVYGNPDRTEFPPIDVCLDVDAISGGDRLLRAWAELRGYKIERDERGVHVENINRHIGEVGKESGHLIAEMCDAISDNKITPVEARKIEHEADDVIDRVRVLKDDMRRVQAA